MNGRKEKKKEKKSDNLYECDKQSLTVYHIKIVNTKIIVLEDLIKLYCSLVP